MMKRALTGLAVAASAAVTLLVAAGQDSGAAPGDECAKVAADLEGTLHSCEVGDAADLRARRNAQGRRRGFEPPPDHANPVRGSGRVVVAVVFTTHLPGPDAVEDTYREGYVRLILQPDGTWVPDSVTKRPPEKL